jgi:hypothetical protein
MIISLIIYTVIAGAAAVVATARVRLDCAGSAPAGPAAGSAPVAPPGSPLGALLEQDQLQVTELLMAKPLAALPLESVHQGHH